MEARRPERARCARVSLAVILFSIMSGLSGRRPQERSLKQGSLCITTMPQIKAWPCPWMSRRMRRRAPGWEAKVLADQNESEFNHHLAGFMVALAGIFVLFQSNLARRWPSAKYVWPACFLLAGIFLLVWSDTELWPFGHRQWLEALQHNREVLQHKTFAILLLLLGAIEFQRVRGRLLAAWSGWVFPLVAICGSILLIFHQHEGGMVGEHHMETMARIQSEHLSYMACGLGIGLNKRPK